MNRLIIPLLIIGSAVAYGQAEKAAGVYKVAGADKGFADTYVYLETKGSKVTGKTLGKEHPVTGIVDGKTLVVSLPDKNATLVLDGSVGQESLKGTATLPAGKQQPVKLYRLLSFWRCGNHPDASHLADSEDDITSGRLGR